MRRAKTSPTVLGRSGAIPARTAPRTLSTMRPSARRIRWTVRTRRLRALFAPRAIPPRASTITHRSRCPPTPGLIPMASLPTSSSKATPTCSPSRPPTTTRLVKTTWQHHSPAHPGARPQRPIAPMRPSSPGRQTPSPAVWCPPHGCALPRASLFPAAPRPWPSRQWLSRASRSWARSQARGRSSLQAPVLRPGTARVPSRPPANPSGRWTRSVPHTSCSPQRRTQTGDRGRRHTCRVAQIIITRPDHRSPRPPRPRHTRASAPAVRQRPTAQLARLPNHRQFRLRRRRRSPSTRLLPRVRPHQAAALRPRHRADSQRLAATARWVREAHLSPNGDACSAQRTPE